MNAIQIKDLCTQYDIRPTKSSGQNFLIDQNIIDKIIQHANLKKDDLVLEVGPGFGVLTNKLLDNAKQVLAIEKDKRLVEFLKAEFFKNKNLEVVQDDILKLNLNETSFKNKDYKIVSNLPYSITSRFLRIFLGLKENRPQEMTLMIQKEVGERILSKAGKMSVLAVMVQFYAEPKILFEVSRNSFWPKPEVDSVMINLKLKEKLPIVDKKKFFRLVKIGFSARRKQLQNNLTNGFKLNNAEVRSIITGVGFDEKIRAQDLSLEDWVGLFNKIEEKL